MEGPRNCSMPSQRESAFGGKRQQGVIKCNSDCCRFEFLQNAEDRGLFLEYALKVLIYKPMSRRPQAAMPQLLRLPGAVNGQPVMSNQSNANGTSVQVGLSLLVLNTIVCLRILLSLSMRK